LTILVTGVAGLFIGFHLARRLLQHEQRVVGVDNVERLLRCFVEAGEAERARQAPEFRFMRLDIAERDELNRLFAASKFDVVINLAAQAGVRYSLVNPHAYIRSNIDGFVSILEACRHNTVRHLIYAPSSSVYGAVTKMPFSVHQKVDHFATTPSACAGPERAAR
jgi:UDP-glucuronate 4-epimerase